MFSIGSMAYARSTWVIQWPIYSCLLLLFGGVPLIVLAAWGFWWLCERPFLSRQAKRPVRSSAQGAPVVVAS